MTPQLCITALALLGCPLLHAADEIEAADPEYTFDPDLGQYVDIDAGGFRGIFDPAGIRKTYHPTDGGGQPWAIATTADDIPYLGNCAWYSHVDPDLSSTTGNGRSENIVCRKIRFGDTVYVSFAFKALDTDSLYTGGTGQNWVFLAQLWQSDAGRPPVFLSVKSDNSLELAKRDFQNDDYNDADTERATLWESADDGWYMQAGQWYHFRLTLKPGRDNDGIIRLEIMNLQSGLWEMAYDGTNIDDVGKAYPAGTNPEFKFKLGGYMGKDHWWSALYDSIRYADTDARSLRDGLIGNARQILKLGYKNTDQSSRGNNITLKNGATWSGTWLYLDGTDDYAVMSVPTTTGGGLADFDVGNQLRIETNFKVTGPLSGTAGVFYAKTDTGGEGYGILVNEAFDKITFVVGHPDGTATWTHYPVSVQTTSSYKAVATYNRFGNITFELFEDGVSLGTMTNTHSGKPIATPTEVWLGKRKSYLLNGAIDSVLVYNNINGGT
ncbi:heparin lyase I family protein [Ruficoccus amylovorans]|uniref:Heparin lyase I family protein n=1 Tax=Ruficoccus amylovorans TaxID=1804625 RepID=A0A842HBB3_9BACT|nr:heparin lyase I family protein [Ruficoccus amylovorans]MBC2592917.1 heparin lyase I family protein [Ruficoccus amylovorans]